VHRRTQGSLPRAKPSSAGIKTPNRGKLADGDRQKENAPKQSRVRRASDRERAIFSQMKALALQMYFVYIKAAKRTPISRISHPKLRQSRVRRAARQKRGFPLQGVFCAMQAYFVYVKSRKARNATEGPLMAAERRRRICPYKKGAGRMHSPRMDSHFAVSDYRLWSPTNSCITQTEPYDPLHGGGQEPYGHWK